MDKTKKVWLVLLVVGFTVGNYIILTMIWPTLQSMIGVAQADPALTGNHSADFAMYKNVLDSMPFYLYFIPAVVGVIEAIIILRTSERLLNRGQV